MLTFIRSFWFAAGLAALLGAVGFFWPSERLELWGLAATCAFWAVIDWLGSDSEDRLTDR
ncbi:hypothetical protein CAF53_20920 [Sphingobium sp. LB126]|nr:hypothetical protein CAF53_20920 [Sphingobium sp. LB126]